MWSRQARNRSGPGEGQGWGLPFSLPLFQFRPVKLQKINEGSGTPANAGHQPPHLAMRRALNGARTLVGVPPRLSPKGIIPSQRLGFRPGFLGLGPNGRYPPSPVPVQGCTSHPGRNAGRLIPKPPGSGLQTRPRAPPSLPRRGVPPRHVLQRSEDGAVTGMETHVKEKVTLRATVATSLSPQGRGRGEGDRKLQNQTPPSEPPHPVLLPQ